MQRLILGSTVGAVLLTGTSGVWADEKTGEMLSNCRPVAEAIIKDGTVAYGQTFGTQFCWGAFALLQGLARRVDDRGKPVLNFCPPPNSRRSQHIAVFVEYAKKNPQLWHEDFDVTLLDAVQLAYPCK